MPRLCAAFGCTSSCHKADCKNGKVSFHRFPLWESMELSLIPLSIINALIRLAKLKRDKFSPNEHFVLCSNHFYEDCFENVSPIYQRRSSSRHLVLVDLTDSNTAYDVICLFFFTKKKIIINSINAKFFR